MKIKIVSNFTVAGILCCLAGGLSGCHKSAYNITGTADGDLVILTTGQSDGSMITWSLTSDDGKSYILQFTKKCTFDKAVTVDLGDKKQVAWTLYPGMRYKASGDKICSLSEAGLTELAGVPTQPTNDIRQVLFVDHLRLISTKIAVQTKEAIVHAGKKAEPSRTLAEQEDTYISTIKSYFAINSVHEVRYGQSDEDSTNYDTLTLTNNLAVASNTNGDFEFESDGILHLNNGIFTKIENGETNVSQDEKVLIKGKVTVSLSEDPEQPAEFNGHMGIYEYSYTFYSDINYRLYGITRIHNLNFTSEKYSDGPIFEPDGLFLEPMQAPKSLPTASPPQTNAIVPVS